MYWHKRVHVFPVPSKKKTKMILIFFFFISLLTGQDPIEP